MVNLSDKLSPKDLEFIKSKNISTESINEQYKNFINGFSNLNIFASANEANGGIKILSEKTLIYYSNLWQIAIFILTLLQNTIIIVIYLEN